VRTFFTGGHFAVTIFFVLSGYVLSTAPMAMIHAGNHLKLGDNLASAMFRRWPRLHIPLIATTFLYMCSWHLFGIWVDGAKQEKKFKDELWFYWVELKNFTFIFRMGGEPWFNYNFHLWSIPVEFRGSIIIYTALLAFSRCRKNARLLCEVVLIFYFMYVVDGWFGAMFVSGMLLCDLDLLALSNDLPRWLYKFESFKELIFLNLFVISIYLGGVPSHDADTEILRKSYGWYYLSFLKPQAVFDFKWFFLFWAATFLVASVPHIPPLKAFFEHRFNQYLGRISFSLYLMHGPVLWTIADRIYAAVGFVRTVHEENIPGWINKFPLPKVGPLGMEPAFFLPHIILLPLTLWLAEICTRLFDEPSVTFAKWLYKKVLAGPPTTNNKP
jgi:peptidoglycan/LPS O-acetylase OafA/YrhL